MSPGNDFILHPRSRDGGRSEDDRACSPKLLIHPLHQGVAAQMTMSRLFHARSHFVFFALNF